VPHNIYLSTLAEGMGEWGDISVADNVDALLPKDGESMRGSYMFVVLIYRTKHKNSEGFNTHDKTFINTNLLGTWWVHIPYY
jgi:hypothetical protein